MIKDFDRFIVLTSVVIGMMVTLVVPATGVASEAPVKEVVASHLGWEVDTVTKGNVCTVLSSHQCQHGVANSNSGGFLFPESVAIDNAPALVSAEHGDLYVVDTGNQRVQVFTPSGAFVFMFGRDVNRTKTEEGATQEERDVCTATSEDVCQAGTQGTAAGQFGFPASATVDPATGNVYVEDFFNWRVQEFTGSGQFVLMLGKEVDETNHGNLCTAVSKDKCKAGEQESEGSTEAAAFRFGQGYGGLLSVGGPEGLLYVGDQHRVQTFKTDGTWTGEIPLTSISSAQSSGVSAITVDKVGHIYIVYSVNFAKNTIYEFGAGGEETNRFVLTPKRPEANAVEVKIGAIAVDLAGRLAITEEEIGFEKEGQFLALRGGLYEVGAAGLHLITEFTNDFSTESETAQGSSIGFNDEDKMYVVGGDEVTSYNPLPVAELVTDPATCGVGADNETNTTFDCVLNGSINPWGVPQTEVWFQWGKATVSGLETTPQSVGTVEELVAVHAVLTGLAPHETYHYGLAAHDQNVRSPEMLVSAPAAFSTPTVPPRIVGESRVLFIKPFSAVLFGELNPENSNTRYVFQYGTCKNLDKCSHLMSTAVTESDAYGMIGTTVEIKELAASTQYRYRLSAENENEEESTEIKEGSFTTGAAPVPRATTGAVNSIGTTSATLSGTVEPDGDVVTYTFELGIYNGENTQYGEVVSESVNATTTAVAETYGLTGLQPGTTYAAKITARSSFGAADGGSVTFTTGGLPTVLTIPPSLEMLPVPTTVFPKVLKPKPKPGCKHGLRRSIQGKCVKPKKKKIKKGQGKGAGRRGPGAR